MTIKKLEKLKPYGITAFLALLSLILMAYRLEFYPFGDSAYMWIDGDQYFSFEHYFGSLLGKNDIFYSWSNVLGGNAMAQTAYYASSPFNVLYMIFPNHMIFTAHAVSYSKIIAASVTFFYCLDHLYRDNSYLMKAALSVCYSFMGYTVFFSWNPSWMDGIVLLPVMYIGILRIIKGKNALLYIAVLALAIISNWYIGYMLCIGSFIFYIALLFLQDRTFGAGIKSSFVPYALSSLSGVGLGMFILLPTYLGLPKTRKLSLVETLKQMSFNCKPITVLSGVFTGQINFSDSNAPLIYVGIFPILLVVMLFVCKKASLKKKLVYAALIAIFMLSFENSFLNTVWHGMSKNAWFNYRYSFLLSFILLLAAYDAYSLVQAGAVSKKEYLISGVILLTLACIVFIDPASKNHTSAMVTDIFLICVTAALLVKGFQEKRVFIAFIVLQVILCSVTNGYYCLKDRPFYTVKDYDKQESIMADAMSRIDDDSFYRMDKTTSFGRCDPSLFDYRGVTNYASTENLEVLDIAKRLGLMHQWMWGIYTSNMPEASESLLGLKYILTDSINAKDYIPIGAGDNIQYYENPHALPILFPSAASGVNAEDSNNFELQNGLWKSINGIDKNVFEPNAITYTSTDDNTVFRVTVNKGGSVYASIPDGQYSVIQVHGDTIEKEIEYSAYGEIYYIGEFSEGDQFELMITTDGGIRNPDEILCYTENLSVIEENASLVNESDISISEISSSHIEMLYSGSRKCISTTIPYDEGWTVYDNGKKASLLRNWNTFLSFELDDTDNHHIKLIYRPAGFKAGAVISLSVLLLVVLYEILRKVKSSSTM